MKKQLLLLLFLICQISFGQQKSTTYYFIRHAEKVDNSKDPELSEKGLERAQQWKNIFESINFDAIYITNFKRTQQTAAPTAASKSVNVKIYDPKTVDITLFKKETQGKKVLIVGHSNSTPQMVNRLINEKVYQDIDDNTFGCLYIVTVIGKNITYQNLKLP